MNVKNQIGLMMSGLVISTVMMKLTMLHVTGMEEIAATMTTQIGIYIAKYVNVLLNPESYGTKILLTIPL